MDTLSELELEPSSTSVPVHASDHGTATDSHDSAGPISGGDITNPAPLDVDEDGWSTVKHRLTESALVEARPDEMYDLFWYPGPLTHSSVSPHSHMLSPGAEKTHLDQRDSIAELIRVGDVAAIVLEETHPGWSKSVQWNATNGGDYIDMINTNVMGIDGEYQIAGCLNIERSRSTQQELDGVTQELSTGGGNAKDGNGGDGKQMDKEENKNHGFEGSPKLKRNARRAVV